MSLINKGLNIKSLMESVQNDAHKAATLLEGLMDLPVTDKKRLSPNDFSIKELYEAVDVSQFSILTGTLISKKVMDAFTEASLIGDSLVTTFPSKLQIDKIAGAYLEGDLKEIEPAEPYQYTHDIKEKYVTIDSTKRGALLAISEESILFDQTGLILMQAAQFGKRAARDREKQILYTVQDLTGYKAWYPTGSQADLYQNAGGAGTTHVYDNLIVDALADFTDVDAANLLLASMKDDTGEPIDIRATTLLVPRALETIASRVLNASVLIGGSTNEENFLKGRYQLLSTAYLDANPDTNGAIIWYLGDFKSQFVWKEIYPLQVLTRPPQNEEEWNRDIAAAYKVRYYGKCGALDYRYVVKSTGAGT